jgi:hypothetical protein
LFFKRIGDVYDEEFEKALKESDGDRHLKNFSLIHLPKLGYTFCPAYDK